VRKMHILRAKFANWFNIRCCAQTHLDRVEKVVYSGYRDCFESLLIGESVAAKRIDVVLSYP
jgi:hypothetical protein